MWKSFRVNGTIPPPAAQRNEVPKGLSCDSGQAFRFEWMCMSLPERKPNLLQAAGTLDEDTPSTEIRLEDGRILRLSTAELLRAQRAPAATMGDTAYDDGRRVVIPLVEEELHVEKRVVETGTVRLHKTTEEREVNLNELLTSRTYDVQRVSRNEVVDRMPEVRQEGDTTIYPVMEEEVVVSRRLVLKEELHVTIRETVQRDTRPVVLRRERVEVERVPAAKFEGEQTNPPSAATLME